MMIKNFLFAAALLSLFLASGCATGGSGPCAINCPAITVTGSSGGVSPLATAGLNLPITATAKVTNSAQTAVNWSITGTACSSSSTDPSNPCGYFTSATTSAASYMGPSSVPSPAVFSIVAALQSNGSVSGSLDLTIVPDTADVAPPTVNVGVNLTQQFTATAEPDQAPQTFTWSCTANGVACVNFTPGSNQAGTALYTAASTEECGNGCVQISAVATVDPTGCTAEKGFTCTPGKTTVVASRVSGTYAFQFSGFDNSGNPVMVAGTFTVAANGSISGVEDLLTASGPSKQNPIQITGGAYTPTSADPNNSNNAGTLTLTLPTGIYPNQYQVVLDGAGDIQMVESDGNGSGSGIAEPSSKKFNKSTPQTFAFGFTGVDSAGNRVGYAGLLPTDSVSKVTGGFIDVNDGGSSSNAICNPGAAPCPVAGSYSYDSTSNRGQLALTSPITMNFDFFVANGNANTKNNAPLTLYAISTDNNPAVLGTMVFQDSITGGYNNAAFNGTSVSALTGATANVSLTLGTTDGTSGGTGGAGNFSGQFDQNNNGTMISYPSSISQSPFAYTYVATNGNTGRYTFQMLGNPGASPVVPPLPFILYASGANRGFLLDQSSSAVMTGTMSPQVTPSQNKGAFANTLLPGTYAVATNSNSASNSSNCSPIFPCTLAMNLLLTSPGNSVFSVFGTLYPPGAAGNITSGTYSVADIGTGTIALTSNSATADYIFYAVGPTDFYMIRNATKDPGVSSAILFMAQ